MTPPPFYGAPPRQSSPGCVIVAVVLAVAGVLCFGVPAFLAYRGIGVVREIARGSPSGPEFYRLTDSNREGRALFQAACTACSGKGSSSDGTRTRLYVLKSDWAAAKLALEQVKRTHPGDFYNEAAAPTEKIGAAMPFGQGPKPPFPMPPAPPR